MMRYLIEQNLSPAEFIDLLHRSTLSERRPVKDIAKITRMLLNADVIVAARDEAGTLIGVARSISDFAFCTYLSDLAVDVAHQGNGIGRELIRLTHEYAGRDTRLILLAAPSAASYYPHIGMEKHDSCWNIPPCDIVDRIGS